MSRARLLLADDHTLLLEGFRKLLEDEYELVGTVEETFVEGYNHATGQWIGRTTQNRTLNFIHPEHTGPKEGATLAGIYCNVRVTRASPNSLAGEAVSGSPRAPAG